MNTKDETYFEGLSKHRAHLADVLDDPALRGVKNSVVEKYSDQAHFIYELLQNADDAKATSARFVLDKDKLIFAHNGTRRFSVTNPATEANDSASGELGDINAITSIANSNKREATIGKFGVGFKSVFQYTSTPHIYDPNIFFKIDRFIVPTRIHEDFPGRQTDETLFVFPFDHVDRRETEAYGDIAEKLRSLDYPLLFLLHLEYISLEIAGTKGLYGKTLIQKQQFGDAVAQFIYLIKNDTDELNEDKLWLFSRKDDKGLTYSVGFFLDEKGNLTAKKHSAFCFFPTKEVTGLNFIVHAPFLLTDSREGIRAGVQHNKDMIKLLSMLAADSLVYLRDIGQANGYSLINDDIFDIIPYDEGLFSDVNDKKKASFKPFYTAILEKMSNEELLPVSDGFVSQQNAYWASVPQIAEIFSDKQLAELCENEKAKWVFRSFGRQETLRKNKALTDYAESITKAWLDEENILKGKAYSDGTTKSGISAAFIEEQSIDWLHTFYKWVSDTSVRTKLIKNKPVFLNQDNEAVAAFDDNGQVILFLPSEDVSGYETINKALLDNKDTAEFIQGLGIKEPSLRDEIYNIILPQYQDGAEIDTTPHFRKFFKYFKECPQSEVDDYMNLIRECEFVSYHSAEDDTVYRGQASDLYWPTEDLKKYFNPKPSTSFVDLDEYMSLVNEQDSTDMESFLTELGVNKEPMIFERELTEKQAYMLKPQNEWRQPAYYKMNTRKWKDCYIDGCKEVMENVTPETSVALWNQLLKIISSKCSHWSNFKTIIYGTYKYFYRSDQTESFESFEARRLRTEPWLLNLDDELVSADKLTQQTLSSQYDTTSDEAKELLRFLGIEEQKEDNEEDENLTDEQRAKIKFADAYADVPTEVLAQAAEEYRAQKCAGNFHIDDDADDMLDDEVEDANPSISRVVKEISKRANSTAKQKMNNPADDKESVFSADEDDYSKPSIDFSKKIEQAKERSEREIVEIARLEDLTQQALNADKYSYGWFKALLELEALNSSESNANSREISIIFSSVEREEGTARTLILKHPNRYIPQYMEDLADIPLELHFANQPMVKVAVEVVNVKSYTLRAKLRTNAQIDGVDLSLVTEAKIEAKNPVFLMEELRKAFNKLDFEDGYDMKRNLCENIEFVFGPPGTGKTTHLAKNVILPIMREADDLKILVLTPTNKAADVLVLRLMECMGADHSYTNWLVRFGATNDSTIEQSGVFRDKTFDIRNFSKNVTVTTISRFPYDYFLPEDSTRLHLSALKWDYIIIDEASMIPVANIIYPLYKKTPAKFIIAGDPFQIEPITTVDIWKNENIYTMVELKSFSEPTTVPHPYHVELLTTQYRSIPEIGEVFSRFAYGGVLKHSRTTESQRPLSIDDFIDVKPLNIIKFPVSKYESIYRPKRLQSKSNYQVYSALFAFEFLKYLSSSIELVNGDEFFRIGLIAPYRAQSDLIYKLMAAANFPKNIDVQVGTIHGFQGDECDIVIALFNPPPSISSSKEMFLNKLNIINVSISRARDYLFVIMPNDDTENVGNLTLIKKVEKLFKAQPDWIEYQSPSVEELMLGSKNYLEENSFSTSHQLVNVYGKPEKRYEVRSEDNAVDVQIHE